MLSIIYVIHLYYVNLSGPLKRNDKLDTAKHRGNNANLKGVIVTLNKDTHAITQLKALEYNKKAY